MLNVKNLSVVYGNGTVGLDDLSFSMESGEKCALIGANGAGKTTLMLSLVGVREFRGEITVGTLRAEKKNLPQLRQRVGLLFQNPDDQLFMPTVYQDVAFGLQNMGISGEQLETRVMEILDELGIAHLKNRSATGLSGGEKRMAALASVLVMEPDLLLLDEPTAFLDPKARRRLLGILQNRKETMLVATHDLGFALELCPRSVVLTKGRLFADGPSGELLFDVEKMDQGGVEAISRYI